MFKNQISKFIPSKRSYHSMVYYKNAFYVFGGSGENSKIYSDLKRFDIEKQIWKNIDGEGAKLSQRYGHVA